MKTLNTQQLDELIGNDGFYTLVFNNLMEGDIIYVATLPHESGSAALGCHLITNSKEEFSYGNSQANKQHRLYRVDEYKYIGYEFNALELTQIKEAYQWASYKMEDNPFNGTWGHWQHFISGLNWYIDDEDKELWSSLEKEYDRLFEEENSTQAQAQVVNLVHKLDSKVLKEALDSPTTLLEKKQEELISLDKYINTLSWGPYAEDQQLTYDYLLAEVNALQSLKGKCNLDFNTLEELRGYVEQSIIAESRATLSVEDFILFINTTVTKNKGWWHTATLIALAQYVKDC